MSVSYWMDLKNTKPKQQCDVCIVGAGVSGLSTAYWLKKQEPHLKITVVDKGELGTGATGRNAGFITCGSVEHFSRMVSKHGEKKALEIWRFAEENRELIKSEIVQSNSKDIEFFVKGAFSLASTESEWNELKNTAKIMTSNKISTETLNQNEVVKRLGAQNFVGGIKYTQDAEVNPISLLNKISQRTEYDLLEHHEVFKITEQRGGKRHIYTNRGVIESTIVVLSLNAYSVALDNYFADKIYPTRGQILCLEPTKQFMEGPCYANFYLDYFRQLPDGALLIGGFRQLEADTEQGFSDHTTETIQNALKEFVDKHLPQYCQSQVSHRWSGVMGFSADGEPLVGALPTDGQIYFCGGFTGHGLGLAFNTGRILANLVLGQAIPDWISSRRF